LCVDNEKFARSRGRDKQFDLLFCGRLTHVKQPLFALDVAKKTAALLLRRVRILYVGTGELESELRARAQSTPEIDVQLYGFAGQAELPALYASSRIFLFPTLWDPWGVVVNEACASGLPIISTPHAGSVGEIIQAGVNGFVYEMDVEAWAHGAQRLLNDHRLYEQFSENSQRLVAGHNYDTAADGVVRAALAARDATVQCRY
jgi:glycosyltransferase involved in cell wall biosynthesis